MSKTIFETKKALGSFYIFILYYYNFCWCLCGVQRYVNVTTSCDVLHIHIQKIKYYYLPPIVMNKRYELSLQYQNGIPIWEFIGKMSIIRNGIDTIGLCIYRGNVGTCWHIRISYKPLSMLASCILRENEEGDMRSKKGKSQTKWYFIESNKRKLYIMYIIGYD